MNPVRGFGCDLAPVVARTVTDATKDVFGGPTVVSRWGDLGGLAPRLCYPRRS